MVLIRGFITMVLKKPNIYILAQVAINLVVLGYVSHLAYQHDVLRRKVQVLEISETKLKNANLNLSALVAGEQSKQAVMTKRSEDSELVLTNGPMFPCRVPTENQLSAGCRVSGRSAKYTGKIVKRYNNMNMALGRSQAAEDLGLVQRYFAGVRGGTFLEMGALDGELYSNSWYFEKELDWRGILIEGSPNNYAKLEQNRPLAIRVNAMVCTEAKTLHWVEGKSIATSGAWELMTDEFRRIKYPKMTEEMVQLLPTVECVRLNDILSRFGIRHVDLFSLDVEGAEMSVLKAIDFNKFSASVILVEVRASSPSVKPLLSKVGYVQDKNIGPNAVFLHPNFKKSIANQLDS